VSARPAESGSRFRGSGLCSLGHRYEKLRDEERRCGHKGICDRDLASCRRARTVTETPAPAGAIAERIAPNVANRDMGAIRPAPSALHFGAQAQSGAVAFAFSSRARSAYKPPPQSFRRRCAMGVERVDEPGLLVYQWPVMVRSRRTGPCAPLRPAGRGEILAQLRMQREVEELG
jgi:hypothetical protein